MKSVILALLVLLVFSQGEALKCYCGGPNKICSGDEETCSGPNQVCASFILQSGFLVAYYQSCYDENECKRLVNSNIVSGGCCNTDLCNR